MSNRLTNTLRDEVVTSVLDEALKEPRLRLRAKRDKLYNEMLDEAIGKHQEFVDEAPTGFFTETTSFLINYMKKGSNGAKEKCTRVHMSMTRRLPAFICNGSIWPSKAHITRHLKLEDEQKLNSDNRATLKSTLNQVVYSYTSKVKLLEDHPYLLKHFPAPDPVTKPLVIRAEDVETLMTCVSKSKSPCKFKQQ